MSLTSRAPRPRVAIAVGRLRRAATGATFPFTFASDLAGLAGRADRPLTFGPADGDPIEAELYTRLEPLRRRIWLQRAVVLLFRAGLLAAAWWVIVAALRFAAVPIPPPLAIGIPVAIGVVAFGLIASQRVTFADAARVADRRLGLRQLLGTAVELTRGSQEGRLARLQRRRATDLLEG